MTARPHVALVLEDYHVITAPAIHAALAWLIELPAAAAAPGASSRAPTRRCRWRACAPAETVTELHADDLRFTPDEAAAFLNQSMGLALTAADLAALEARTEGWIAGLQLAALALRGNQRSRRLHPQLCGHQPLYRGLPGRGGASSASRPSCRPFCSRLPSSTGCAARCVMPCWTRATGGWSAAQPSLEALERANLFVVPLDADRQWYRYHHLFADVLRQQLVTDGVGRPKWPRCTSAPASGTSSRD